MTTTTTKRSNMSNVIDITGRLPIADDDPECGMEFGGCPECAPRFHTDGYINVGKGHWFFCLEHRVRWFAGSNLFSSWRNETEDEQRERYHELDFGSFRKVTPRGL